MSLADRNNTGYNYTYYIARKHGYSHEEAMNIAYGAQIRRQQEIEAGIRGNKEAARQAKKERKRD